MNIAYHDNDDDKPDVYAADLQARRHGSKRAVNEQARIAALEAVLRSLVEGTAPEFPHVNGVCACTYCRATNWHKDAVEHLPHCPVVRGRKLLGE